MTKHNEENVRIKRELPAYPKEAQRYSDSSVDAAASALARFEAYTKHRGFRQFHQQAIAFKGMCKLGDAPGQSAIPAASTTRRATFNQARTGLGRELADAEPVGVLDKLGRGWRGGSEGASRTGRGLKPKMGSSSIAEALPAVVPDRQPSRMPATEPYTLPGPASSVSSQSPVPQGLLERLSNFSKSASRPTTRKGTIENPAYLSTPE